jgi:guanylate kinase
LVLVTAPSAEAQEARLRARGDPPDKVAHRLELGHTEEELGRALADHVVVNDDLDRAVREVAGIVEACRSHGPR